MHDLCETVNKYNRTFRKNDFITVRRLCENPMVGMTGANSASPLMDERAKELEKIGLNHLQENARYIVNSPTFGTSTDDLS